MKKNKKKLMILVVIVISIFIGGIRYNQFSNLKSNVEFLIGLAKGTYVANITYTARSPVNKNTMVGIGKKDGVGFKITYHGSAKEGSAVMKILNSGEIKKQVELNDSGEIKYVHEGDNNTTIIVEYKDFVGNVDIKVYKET